MSTSPDVRPEAGLRPSSAVAIDLAAVRRDFPILALSRSARLRSSSC